MYEVVTRSLLQLVDFTDEELFQFMQKLKPVVLKKYSFYLKPGQVCKNMAIVQKGCFRYYFETEKGEQTTHFSFEGGWIGDYESFLQHTPSAYFIEVMEDSEIFTLSFADQRELYKMSQRFETFGRVIAEQLFIQTAKQSKKFLIESAQERYLDLLKTHPVIFERVPQHLIASYLGIRPQSLSRIRSKIFSDERVNIG